MRRPVVLVVLAAAALAVVVGAALALRGRDDAPEATGTAPAARAAAAQPEQRLARCVNRLSEEETRACYVGAFDELVVPAEDPRPVLKRISDVAWSTGGFLLPNCHGLMHTVGRNYVQEHGVTLASLMDYLPRSNDPGCSAGFAHGLVTGVAPQIDVRNPRGSAAVCGEAGTRFQRYSCVHGFGHAFMRLNADRLAPALELCSALGPQAAPDCAQGAYHDYWFAVIGADDATAPPDAVTDPRALCGSQPREFVRPCWYRAFIDSRPAGFQVTVPEEIDRLCTGLTGVQRGACVTAASVIGPPEPVEQLALCAELPPEDADDCARGTKVQNLLQQPPEVYVDLIGRCATLPGASSVACYRWLGKVISVVTDGDFERTGCPQVTDPPGRRACVEGARAMDEPLVTFS